MAFKSNTRFFAIITIVIWCCSSCKKDVKICHDETDPSCANYDPCIGKTNADADFYIYEDMVFGLLVEADTVYATSHARLIRNKNIPNQQYKWIINGLGTTITSTDTSILIDNNILMNYQSQFVDVTLIATVDAGKCTLVASSDTVTKRFYVWPMHTSNSMPPVPVVGRYLGQFASNPGIYREIKIVIDTFLYVDSSLCEGVIQSGVYRTEVIKGFPYINTNSENAAKRFSFTSNVGANGFIIECFGSGVSGGVVSCYGGKVPKMQGHGYLNPNNNKNLIMNYSYKDTLTNQWVNDSFSGLKLN